MKKNNKIFLLSILFLTLFISLSGVSAADIKTNNSTGQSNYTGPQKNSTIWNASIPTTKSNPAVDSNGTVYIGSSDGTLYAYNSSGSQKWNYTMGSIYTTPVIGENNTVYITSNDGIFYAINNDGSQKWNYTIGNTGEMRASAAIATDGTVYIGSNNGKFYAFNPDGTLKWLKSSIKGALAYNAVIGSYNAVYVMDSSGIIYAFHSNSSIKCEMETGFINLGTSPAIGPDGTVYIYDFQGNLYAMQPTETHGNLKWFYPINATNLGSTPAVSSDGTVYLIANYQNGLNKLIALNPNGTFKWEFKIGSVFYGSPCIGKDGIIYVGCNDGLYSINSDGTLRWKALIGSISSSPIIDANSTMYIGTYVNSQNGIFYAFKDIGPVAEFSTDSTQGNNFLTVHFTNLSTDNPTSWFWDFGDGATSTDENPTHNYTKAGNYTVKLTISKGSGEYDNDTLTKTNYIIVLDTIAPVVNASLKSGTYNSSKNISLIVDKTAKIYYTTDGSNPTSSSKLYSGPITIANTTTLKFMAISESGIQSSIYSERYIIDSSAPTVYVNIKSGIYNSDKRIVLKMSENGTIFYMINGVTKKYTGSFSISKSTRLKVYAVDKQENKSPVYSYSYVIDKKRPKVKSVNPKNHAYFSRAKTIVIRFNEKIKASKYWNRIYIKNIRTGEKIAITKTIKGNKLYLKTSTRARYGLYKIYIPYNALKDFAGNKFLKYTSYFRTSRK